MEHLALNTTFLFYLKSLVSKRKFGYHFRFKAFAFHQKSELTLKTMNNQSTEDYLRILLNEFQQRKKKNKKYSLRAFAKFLGVSHALLSLVLLKKKGLSPKMADKISTKLGLSHLERSIFISSVEKCFSRSAAKKTKASHVLNQLYKQKQFKPLTQENASQIDHWAYVAVFEAIHSKKAQTVEELCFFLDQKPSMITKVATYLQEISAIAEANGKFLALSSSLHTTNDIPTKAMVSYHVSMAQKAIESVQQQPVHIREFQNAILTVNQDSLNDAKKMIRNFILEFNTRFYIDNDNTQLYSLFVSFFKLGRS